MPDKFDRNEIESMNTQEFDDLDEAREMLEEMAKDSDRAEWSDDEWGYWCRKPKKTAVEWLRNEDVLP